jgi:hypothetical protein
MNQEWLDKIKAEPGVPGVTLTLIAELERLHEKAEALYKAASAIADQVIEEEAMGAEFDEDSRIEIGLYKDEVEELISIVLNWRTN